MDEGIGRLHDHPVAVALASAREALAVARSTSTMGVDPLDLAALAAEAWATVAAAQAAFVSLVAEIDARGVAAALGAPSTAAWLRGGLRLAPDQARSTAALAAAVGGELAATGSALAAGELSMRHARAISRTLAELPAAAGPAVRSAAEAHLIEQAAAFDPVDLARLGRHVLDVVDPGHADVALAAALRGEDAHARRRELRMCPDGHGCEHLSGRLDAEGAALVRAALDPLAAPRPSSNDGADPRTAGQRYGDALVELARRALADGHLPDIGGERPHIVLTMSLDDLRAGVGAGWLTTGEPLSATTARRLACDARILPVVLGGAGEILDVGRAQRTFTAALRRALVARDGGCAFPGCARPPGWCDGHHIVSWATGGMTSLDNGVLLCGHHHRLVHAGDWQVRAGPDRLPEFVPPAWIDPQRRPRRGARHRERSP